MLFISYSDSELLLNTDIGILERTLRRQKRKEKTTHSSTQNQVSIVGDQKFKEEVELANKPAPRKQAIRGTWVRIDQGTQEGAMATQREDDLPICEYAAHKKVGDLSYIKRPPIEANNFKIEASTTFLLNNVQFSGLPHEDPNLHISSFLQL